MNSILTSLPVLLPIVYVWAEKQELIILEEGRPLDEEGRADAQRAGVQYPEKIRVLRTETLPQPANEDVMFVARQVGLFSNRSTGLSLGYGICLRHETWDCRLTLVHECVHVAQYERKGGIRPFLNEYLRECVDPGYPFGALEQEALLVAREICKSSERNRMENAIEN